MDIVYLTQKEVCVIRGKRNAKSIKIKKIDAADLVGAEDYNSSLAKFVRKFRVNKYACTIVVDDEVSDTLRKPLYKVNDIAFKKAMKRESAFKGTTVDNQLDSVRKMLTKDFDEAEGGRAQITVMAGKTANYVATVIRARRIADFDIITVSDCLKKICANKKNTSAGILLHIKEDYVKALLYSNFKLVESSVFDLDSNLDIPAQIEKIISTLMNEDIINLGISPSKIYLTGNCKKIQTTQLTKVCGIEVAPYVISNIKIKNAKCDINQVMPIFEII